MSTRTYSQKASEVSRAWLLIDAASAPLGRVAGVAAKYLIGKHKPTYTAHIDDGDHVVIINTDALVVTGNKELDKKYYRHSGYPGSTKTTTLAQQRSKNSTKIMSDAIAGMLPKNKLAAGRMQRLKVYTGSEHPHAPQSPKAVKVTN